MRLPDLHGLNELDARWPIPLDRPFQAQFARDVGVPQHLLTELVRRRLLLQPLKGVYVARQLSDSTWLRTECLRLVVPDDAVIVDRHAAWLLGAPMSLEPGENIEARPISVFRPSGHGRLRNDLSHSGERNLRPSDVMELDRLLVTTPLRTAWDLGRVRYPEPALSGIDAMLRLGVDKSELLDGVERFKGMRWVTTLRAVARLGDGRAASPPESVLRLRWIQAHLPEPVPQLEVRDGKHLLGLLDLGNEELRYAAEYDGEEWHSSPDEQEHDRLRRHAIRNEGWIVDVFTRKDVFGRNSIVEQRLRAGAAAARRRLTAAA